MTTLMMTTTIMTTNDTTATTTTISIYGGHTTTAVPPTLFLFVTLDPTWKGSVEYHELLFGALCSYIFLVEMWERLLLYQKVTTTTTTTVGGNDWTEANYQHQPPYYKLNEWRYMLVHLCGCAAYLVNHWFSRSPYYSGFTGLLAVYSYIFWYVWYRLLVCPVITSIATTSEKLPGRPWCDCFNTLLLMVCSIPYIVAFMGFEYVARFGVNKIGICDFWFVVIAYVGTAIVILWRGGVYRRLTPPIQCCCSRTCCKSCQH